MVQPEHPNLATPSTPSTPSTLCVDIGGTRIKMRPFDGAGSTTAERLCQPTPPSAGPDEIMAVLMTMLEQQAPFDRMSVGFPGVVVDGVVYTAPNLAKTKWCGFDLAQAITKMSKRPTQVKNDADMLGLGVVSGRGVELVLTLGTGLGASLFTEGVLVPNLELGHHPFSSSWTYEQYLSDTEVKSIGPEAFRERVAEVIVQLAAFFNYQRLFLGGGNARLLLAETLPSDVSVFTHVEGLRGGLRFWS